jgi:hypothetical protein
MKGAKPFILRHIHRPIIAIKKSVMQLVVKMPYGQAFFVLYQECVKASMPKHRPQGLYFAMNVRSQLLRGQSASWNAYSHRLGSPETLN